MDQTLATDGDRMSILKIHRSQRTVLELGLWTTLKDVVF